MKYALWVLGVAVGTLILGYLFSTTAKDFVISLGWFELGCGTVMFLVEKSGL